MRPPAAGQSAKAGACGLGLDLLGIVGLAVFAGIGFGFGTLAWAWGLHLLLMPWMLAVEARVSLPYEGGWYRVRSWEPRLYRRLGVLGFMRLLRRVGWERANRQAKKFDGTRTSLVAYERGTRSSEFNHAALGLVGFGLFGGAAALRAWDTAAWLLAVNMVLHVYPVMLQRTMRARVQGLLRSAGHESGSQNGPGAGDDGVTRAPKLAP